MPIIALALALAPPPPATQTCPDGSVILATDYCDAPPPPPATQTCPDGSVILATQACQKAIDRYVCRRQWNVGGGTLPAPLAPVMRMEVEGGLKLRLTDAATGTAYAGAMASRGTSKAAGGTMRGPGDQSFDFAIIGNNVVVNDVRGALMEATTTPGVRVPYFCTTG